MRTCNNYLAKFWTCSNIRMNKSLSFILGWYHQYRHLYFWRYNLRKVIQTWKIKDLHVRKVLETFQIVLKINRIRSNVTFSVSGHVYFLPAIVMYGVTCDLKNKNKIFIRYAINLYDNSDLNRRQNIKSIKISNVVSVSFQIRIQVLWFRSTSLQLPLLFKYLSH